MAAALLHPHLSFIRSFGPFCVPINYPKWGFRISIQCSDFSSPDRDFGLKSRKADNKSVLEQKKAEEQKEYGAIDYNAPTEKSSSTIGVGVAVVAFGLVFALGDFLPFGRVSPTEEAATVNKISEEERATLEKGLKQFEEILAISPEDSTALEKKPSDPDTFRLLGEVKYELKDYEGSVLAYRSAERTSKSVDFEILRGLANSLLVAKKPDEAIQVLLASCECLNKENSSGDGDGTVKSTGETRFDVDPVQVEYR